MKSGPKNMSSLAKTGRVIFALSMGLMIAANCAMSPEARKAAHVEKAEEYFGRARYQEAVIEYFNVLQIEQDNPTAIQNIGLALYELGQLGEAFRYLQRAQEIAPGNIDVRLKLAAIYLLGNPETISPQRDRPVPNDRRAVWR